MKTIASTLGIFALVICISLAGELVAEPATNILDLPTELLWRILERNNLKDLISFAKVHPHFRNVVDPLVRRKISNQKVRLEYGNYDFEYKLVSDTERRNGLNEDLKDRPTTSDLFELFGHHITKLSIQYRTRTSDDIQENVNRIISKHGAMWLKEISFDFTRAQSLHHALFGLEGPFIQAENVTFLGGLSYSRFNFTEVFPVVRNLNIKMITIAEGLDQYFPYLERLTIPDEWAIHRANFPSFQQTLELNPRIKHLTISKLGIWDALEMLNKIRPDLESLEISQLELYHFKKGTEPLRFKNMKTLKLLTRSAIDDNQLPLEFGNLEEIEFNNQDIFDILMEIMMQNPKLKKVTSNKLSSDQFLRMINGLPNLEEYTMKHEESEQQISVNEIVDFLRNAHQLKRVSFLGLYKQCDEVAPQVKNIWINFSIPYETCFFVRKTLD